MKSKGSSMPSFLRRSATAVGVLISVLAVSATSMIGVTPTARADSAVTPYTSTIRVSGAGWGHGYGMSQYGAYGAAVSGLSWKQILAFYYPGTKLAALPSGGTVRVWITADDDASLTVLAATGLRLRDTARGTTWTLPTGKDYTQWKITRSGSASVLSHRTAAGSWKTTKPALVTTALWQVENPHTSLVKVALPGSRVRELRGQVSLTPYGPSARTVNRLPMEDYLRSVVPSEMPTSWAADAVRAQSVAARSYAARLRAGSSTSAYDLCDTTSCQVYTGAADTVSGRRTSHETAAGDAAIRATANSVVMSGSSVALTQFASSNGGHSAQGGYVYLAPKTDPYDGVTRNQTWTMSLTSTIVQQAYPTIGTLRSVRVVSRDGQGRWGGRVKQVALVGSRSTVTISGDTFRTRFGLKSTLFTLAGGIAPSGVVYARWQTLGGVTGWVGAPAGSERPVGTGREARFDGADLLWSPVTGTHEVHGKIRATYRRLGGATWKLGFPTTDQTNGPVAGSRQNLFTGGAIYWSSATGAWEVHGKIYAYYASSASIRTRLGLPLGDQQKGSVTGTRMTYLQRGAIYWTSRSALGRSVGRPIPCTASSVRRSPDWGCPPPACAPRPPAAWSSSSTAGSAARPRGPAPSPTADPPFRLSSVTECCPSVGLSTDLAENSGFRPAVGSQCPRDVPVIRVDPIVRRLPDDLPEARVWRPDLLAAPEDPGPGAWIQPALFATPRRSVSRHRPFADLLDGARFDPSGGGSRRGRGSVQVTVFGPAPPRDLPDVRRWSLNLGIAIVEVLLGHRALAQLLRWLNDETLGRLGLAASVARDRRGAPVRRERLTVASTRVQILGPDVVEVCLHATRRADRFVVAFRLVAERDRWLCTELDLLTPQRQQTPP